MTHRLAWLAPALLAAAIVATPARASDTEAMEAYLDFVEYHGGTIAPAQIPEADWPGFFIIDARDAEQFSSGHIPGAHNIEWRRVLAERASIPTDKPVLIYCNTGSLSAQAGFALRVAGHENVRILQGGFEAWKANRQ